MDIPLSPISNSWWWTKDAKRQRRSAAEKVTASPVPLLNQLRLTEKKQKAVIALDRVQLLSLSSKKVRFSYLLQQNVT